MKQLTRVNIKGYSQQKNLVILQPFLRVDCHRFRTLREFASNPTSWPPFSLNEALY